MDLLDPIQKKEIETICNTYSIKKLSLFGSAARADLGSDSDIDILVEFFPDGVPSLWRFVELQDELIDLFGRKVEVATQAILNNPYRRRSIENDLKELYAAWRTRCRIFVGHGWIRERDAGRISETFKETHPQIPWRQIIGQRNIIVHEYGQIDYEMLYQTAMNDIPERISAIEPMLPPLDS